MAAPEAPAFSSDYRRLQRIEQHVVSCVELAAVAAEQLSHVSAADPQAVAATCTAFLNKIREAQALVAEGAAEVTHPRSFEANAYHQLAHTVLAQERLAAVAALLRRAKEALGAAADGAASGQQQGGAAAMNTVS